MKNGEKAENRTNFYTTEQLIRVPGGWIYTTTTVVIHSVSVSSVFVPFNNEFMPPV
jgi:hypothetical protein